jgi:hypothetical protein
LESKARELQARARQVGWEQTLWEGLLRALGYKHNAWPMQRIAELVLGRGRWPGPVDEDPAIAWQARLLGVAGFLPDDLTRTRRGTDHYLRRIWDVWWRLREEWGDDVLPRSCWRLHGLRPANHPQRRLALAAHWLGRPHFLEDLEHWFQDDVRPREHRRHLASLMQVSGDPFWVAHWTLRAEITGPARPLLGPQRLTDLAVNVLLPWFWMRAVAANNQKLRDRAETFYVQWPSGEDNSLLRMARVRLLGQASAKIPPRAVAQQGLLQIMHDFCERTNALCSDCAFPASVAAAVGSA